MHLTKYEKETIINWNQEEEIASIYTFDKDLQRRLKEFSKKYPELCWLKSSTKEGSKTKVLRFQTLIRINLSVC